MESVEELFDHIVLLHKARKTLDGKVSEIKNAYRNNTFNIKYHLSDHDTFIPAENLYKLIKSTTIGKETVDTIQVRDQHSINDVLQHLIPHVEITELHEIIPSMNDIFIQHVNAT